jgi:hypothetical protein
MPNDATGVALAIAGTVLMLFGLGFLTAPTVVLAAYGVGLDVTAERLVRMCGTAIVPLGVLGLLARKLDSRSRRLAGKCLLCFFWLKSVVTLEAVLGGMFNVFGWSILLIDIPMSLVWTWILWRGDAA